MGNQVRDFCYVEDVADAFVALLDSPVTGCVNVASGHPLIVKDLVYAIADKLNRRELVQLGALPTSPDDPPLLVADVRRLGDEVGWSPRYDLDAGLERTIRWWRTQSGEEAEP
jgi:nucleoside-diphosphate-sugar epimerase